MLTSIGVEHTAMAWNTQTQTQTQTQTDTHLIEHVDFHRGGAHSDGTGPRHSLRCHTAVGNGRIFGAGKLPNFHLKNNNPQSGKTAKFSPAKTTTHNQGKLPNFHLKNNPQSGKNVKL